MNKPKLSDDSYCFAIRQAARYVTQQYERHLAQVELTPAQYTILQKLQRRSGQTMSELAQALVMDRTSLVRALQPLRRDGLVLRLAPPQGTREWLWQLSTAGAARYTAARARWQAAQGEFEAKFGTQRAAALRTELFDISQGAAPVEDG